MYSHLELVQNKIIVMYVIWRNILVKSLSSPFHFVGRFACDRFSNISLPMVLYTLHPQVVNARFQPSGFLVPSERRSCITRCCCAKTVCGRKRLVTGWASLSLLFDSLNL